MTGNFKEYKTATSGFYTSVSGIILFNIEAGHAGMFMHAM
tara:strand:+ start:1855 stop:1974 length:120 start_codon:yes stop_codon:yes gene_type:complete